MRKAIELMKPGCPATMLLLLPSSYIINASVPQPQGQHKDLPLLSLGSDQFSSVQSGRTLWGPTDCSTPGLPVHHQLPEFTQTESVMPSNHLILCGPLLLLPSIFARIGVFSNESSSSHQVAKVLEFQLQHQSFQ